MIYELWETEGRNLIDDFDTEADALDMVRRAVTSQSRDTVRSWTLLLVDRRGKGKLLAEGESLIQMALAPSAS